MTCFSPQYFHFTMCSVRVHSNLQTTPSVVGSAEIPLWHEGSKTYIIVVCPTAFAIEKGVGDLWQSVVLCRVRAVV